MKNILIIACKPKIVRKTYLNKGYTLCSYNDIHIELNLQEKYIGTFVNNTPMSQFELVYFRTAQHREDFAIPLALALHHSKVKVLESALLSIVGNAKAYQYVQCAIHILPIPHTFIAYADRLKKMSPILKKRLGYPFIIKMAGKSRGNDNFLVKNKDHFFEIIESYTEKDLFVAQKYIPNDFDYRILTLGYKPALAYKRTRDTLHTHLNNVSQGGNREIVNLTSIPQLVRLSARISKILKREVCGVDIVVDTATHKPFILEANTAPQLYFPPALEAVRNYLENHA